MIKRITLQKHVPIFIIGILFSVFGFISWLNAILIPYFKIACNLNLQQAMLVALAFYISYFIMAFPSSAIIQRTGFKKGMVLGLVVMAAGALVFIPAAMARSYPVFLTGLFIQATGLTLLQTASNPYITLLGPIESAATRISIMGICNKVAGAIAPLLLMYAITNHPDEIDQLQKQLPLLPNIEQQLVLDELAQRLITPYSIMTLVLLFLGAMIHYSRLPEIDTQRDVTRTSGHPEKNDSIFNYPQLLLGAVAIFCSVSVEVLVVDSIINYGEFHGLSFKAAKFFATYALMVMILSYFAGVLLIPKYITQKTALKYSAVIGVIFSFIIILSSGILSVWFLAGLGLANAMLWPSIWPLALNGVGDYTKKGSALLIMGIVGGAVTPYIYGMLADTYNSQQAYLLLIPLYLFMFYYAVSGSKRKHAIKQV